MSVLSVYWWLKTGSCWFLHQKCVTTKGKSVNKVCIWILNYHLVNKFKTEAFWFVFKSIWYKIFTNCPKNFFGGGGGGGNRKEPKSISGPHNLEPADDHPVAKSFNFFRQFSLHFLLDVLLGFESDEGSGCDFEYWQDQAVYWVVGYVTIFYSAIIPFLGNCSLTVADFFQTWPKTSEKGWLFLHKTVENSQLGDQKWKKNIWGKLWKLGFSFSVTGSSCLSLLTKTCFSTLEEINALFISFSLAKRFILSLGPRSFESGERLGISKSKENYFEKDESQQI